jgi:hypothetical protein
MLRLRPLRCGGRPIRASPAESVNVLRNKITAAGGELIEFGTRQTHLDGTYTKNRCLSGIASSRTGRASGGISIPPFLPVSSWITVSMRSRPRKLGQVWKRSSVASNGFEPASGKGFALPHVTLSVRAGRLRKYHANHREAWDGVALAVLPVSRAPESGEAPL